MARATSKIARQLRNISISNSISKDLMILQGSVTFTTRPDKSPLFPSVISPVLFSRSQISIRAKSIPCIINIFSKFIAFLYLTWLLYVSPAFIVNG